MTNPAPRLLAVLAACLMALSGARAGAAPGFDALLDEAAATFAPPAGFAAAPVPTVPAFPFDRALAAPDGGLTVAYAVRPIARMEIDYNDPHSSAPNPNHIFPLVYGSLVGLLSAGGHSPSREFPAQEARARFNADWASATAFDLDPAVSPDHRYGFLLALHKNARADVYVLFLFSDPAKAKGRIDALLTSLKFRPGGAADGR